MLSRLGPSFIKAGQVLANRPDVLRADYMTELCILQDNVPAFPSPKAFEIMEVKFARARLCPPKSVTLLPRPACPDSRIASGAGTTSRGAPARAASWPRLTGASVIHRIVNRVRLGY
jgi:hypothetical protein